MAKVLLVDDDEDVLFLTRDYLRVQGFECTQALNGEEALKELETDQPDIIISDIAMPVMDGLTFCKKVKSNIFLCRIPVILLTARAHIDDRISGFESGADDYLIKPVDFRELGARVKAILRRYKLILDTNPSTKLPGANAVEEEITRRLKRKQKFTVCYADLDNFKSYADTYGFEMANKAIKLTAKILGDCVRETKERESYIAHIGGDDFLLLARPGAALRLCRLLVKSFDDRIKSCFNETDLANGYYLGFDRDGNFRKFPIMAISIAMLAHGAHEFTSAREIGETAARLKRVAKKVIGSNIVKL
ncbi:MAG: response regulator [Candidatus Riflebacteria bacterium]|nr:response regulator [Candidatus Riflebacteria bacterium]